MKNSVVSALINDPKVRSIGLKESTIEYIIHKYEDIMVSELLDNGIVSIPCGMTIEVVQLEARVHVLRGTTYRSNRRYKLKLNMDDKLYTKVGDYYSQIEKELL